MFVPVFFVQLHPNFLAFVEVYSRTHFYHAVLHVVLLPVLGMLILYGLLSHQVAGTVCICYQSLCVVILWHSTSCLTLGLVIIIIIIIINITML